LAKKLDLNTVPSVVRQSRVQLEAAQAYAHKREMPTAIRYLESAANISIEAVALIPWARTLADELAATAPAAMKRQAAALTSRLKSTVLAG
jgi:hypothetical protein